MTALGSREVERSFSVLAFFSTGLPDPNTNEAGGQDFSDLANARR
jgi:hypothetical protein